MISENIMGETMWLPDHDPQVLHHSRASVTSVLEGEYSYPREFPEDVHTIVDVGHNLGAFAVWACRRWWPGKIDSIVAYDPHYAVFEYATRNTQGLPIHAYHAAVTTNPEPRFSFEEAHPANWGGAHTRGDTGVAVPALHPSRLPPCDVLKIDCEGCELEIFEHYPHFGGVKVCMFEFHEVKFRDPMMGKMKELGFVMRRGNPIIDTAPDVQVWVRPPIREWSVSYAGVEFDPISETLVANGIELASLADILPPDCQGKGRFEFGVKFVPEREE